MKQVSYSRAALRALRKMPKDSAERIMAKIDQYAADPKSQANNVKGLQGRDGIRLRVGDWRVIMRDAEVLAVLEIGPRGSVYEA